jgi:bacteriorhodopsin
MTSPHDQERVVKPPPSRWPMAVLAIATTVLLVLASFARALRGIVENETVAVRFRNDLAVNLVFWLVVVATVCAWLTPVLVSRDRVPAARIVFKTAIALLILAPVAYFSVLLLL